MKSKIIAVAIFGLTVATVLFFPSLKSKVISGQTGAPPGGAPPITPITLNDAPKVEVVFVLDTTGSMSGLIQAAKEKIWSIATTMASAQPAPEIRMGLVAYRDRGDAYVTRVVDLSSDLDSMYATLMDFQADGGGDTPESVNQVLHDAVHSMSWCGNDDSYKVVFLVGDAPPHMDYQDDVKYMQTLAAAEDRGIVVNTVQCGEIGATVAPWQQIAALGHGRYFQVEQAGSALAMTTPYDAALARLSAELDATRIFYGDAEEKEKMKLKAEATDKLHALSSIGSRARRATFNASVAGKPGIEFAEVKRIRVATPAVIPNRMSRPTRGSRNRPSSMRDQPISVAGQRRRTNGSSARYISKMNPEVNRPLAADRSKNWISSPTENKWVPWQIHAPM